MLNLALRPLRQALSSEETLSKAPFESILLSIWYVLALHKAVQTFKVKSLITCQETLCHRVAVNLSKLINISHILITYLWH